MKEFDAIVVGSGQAGTPLVFKLATEGKRVAFIEKDKVGGTCLNVGCTPTQAYVASARRMWDINHSQDMGVQVPEGSSLNLKSVKERKDRLIEKSRNGIEKSIQENDKITFYRGEASFSGFKTIQINGIEITAEQIFINVGGKPNIPDSFKSIDYLTSSTILELTDLPEHLIIVGGSYIGLEFAQMFARFGSRVTVVEKNTRIISKEDEAVSDEIMKFMELDGVDFRLESNCISGRQNGDGMITVDLDCNEKGMDTVSGTHLLLAVGRRSNADVLRLEKTGLLINENGFIPVNEFCQTDVEGIFALGDCNGMGAFTHTAYNDFQIVSDYLFGNQKRKISDRIATYGLFVDPPLGRCGLTRRQAEEQGFHVKVAYRPMTKVARAREKGETYGFMEMIIDADTDRILGAVILGVGGDEVISGILNVMYSDQPYTLIRDSIQIHPTVSELIPTILESPE